MQLATIFLIAVAALNTVNIKLPSGKVLTVEAAIFGEDVARGLIGRKSLPPNSGILLVNPGDVRTRYNLMGYPGPMDLIYLDESKQVINMIQNAEVCKKPDCGYDSVWPFRYALQLTAGSAKQLNIHAGDYLMFDLPAVKSPK